jgi:hypothetical protein
VTGDQALLLCIVDSGAQANVQPAAPTIAAKADQGGTIQDLWYFGSGITSQSSYATQFTYSITLTATGSGTPVWNVASGSDKVVLTPHPGTNTATISSSGTKWSSQLLDVGITVTMSGLTSPPYTITTHVSYSMVFDSLDPQCPPTYGYLDTINYKVQDQLGNSLSVYAFDFNEKFTTGFTNTNNSNWPAPLTGPATNTMVSDTISGAVVNFQPPPTPTPVCSGNDTETQYATQEWYVGSLNTGSGIKLQSDTWTRYADWGTHNGITPFHP